MFHKLDMTILLTSMTYEPSLLYPVIRGTCNRFAIGRYSFNGYIYRGGRIGIVISYGSFAI